MVRKKIGVALSSGGMKGIAHIGVLKIFEKYKIPIDYISGTSMGAMIAALYASEPNAKKLEKEVLNENLKDLFDYTLSRYGLIKGKKIEAYLEKKLNHMTFKELKIPTFITAFDIKNKREIIFTKGSVAKAVRASISIPGLFFPVENKKEILIDGGIVDPIPTEVLREAGADIVIAINVNSINENKSLKNETATLNAGSKKLPSMFESVSKSLEIYGAEASKADLAKNDADLVINVNLEGIELFESKKTKLILRRGENAAQNALEQINNLASSNILKTLLKELEEGFAIDLIAKGVKKGVNKTLKTVKILK